MEWFHLIYVVKQLKILVIGEGAVGKTSIATRYTTGAFKESHLMTIGANFMLKDYKSTNGENYRLSIWDTAGQENFRKIVEGYYKGAKGALVVFSIINRESFEELDYWLTTARNKTPGIDIVLVGNKVDLEDERVVSTEEAQSRADELGISYFETSAKTNTNINEVFASLTEKIIGD